MASIRYLLFWLSLLVLTSSQRLDSPDGDCDPGFVCKSHTNCPHYQAKKARLDALGGAEYEGLLEELRGLVCNKAKRGICCYSSYYSSENLEVGMPFVLGSEPLTRTTATGGQTLRLR